MKQLLLTCCFFPLCLHAQNFVQITHGISGVAYGTTKWGDIDNDGDLDIIVSGDLYSGAKMSDIYIYEGSDSFAKANAGLVGLWSSVAAFCDYDNDNDLDLLLCGEDGNYHPYTKLYQNSGGVFTDVNAGIIPLQQATSIDWGDYDNDGDQDVLIVGEDSTNTGITKLYRNDDGIFHAVSTGISVMYKGAAVFGDYDSDGDKDILVMGVGGNMGIFKLYKNTNGTFTNVSVGFPVLYDDALCSATWGDYDCDGDLDLVTEGQTPIAVNFVKIFRNDGTAFTDVGASLPALQDGKAHFGDYDNDGDNDVLVFGSVISRIYMNDSLDFSQDLLSPLAGVRYGDAEFGDYDFDHDLDLVEVGEWVGIVYRNDSSVANAIPEAPLVLKDSLSGETVILSWNKGSDTETPAISLSYNVRVGLTPSGTDLVSPMANLITGERLLPALGNVDLDTFMILKNVPPGTYYWSVQSIDQGFQGSGFSETDSFTVIATGIRELSKELNIYPSVTAISFSMDIPISNCNLEIYSSVGERVEELKNVDQGSDVIDVSSLSSGVYFIQLSNNEKFFEGKFIKE